MDMKTTEELSAQGYSVLASGVTAGHLDVVVWSRLSPWNDFYPSGPLTGTSENTGGWDYLVSLPNLWTSPGADPNTHRVLNLDSPFQCSPDVGDIGSLLIKANVLAGMPPCGHEYAITVNGSNDFDHKFSSSELRSRAVDELVLFGDVELTDDVCFFEIEPNGDQPDDKMFYLSFDVWICERSLLSNERTAPQRLRLAILTHDVEAALAALEDGALTQPVAGTQKMARPPFMLAALLGCDEILAAIAAKADHASNLTKLAMAEGSNPPFDVNATHRDGDTALHLAARGQHEDCCRVLLGLGASLDVLNDHGASPMDSTRPSLPGNPVMDLLMAVKASRAAMTAIDKILPIAEGTQGSMPALVQG